MIKIEALYPEVCNLYGDGFNLTLLKAALKDAPDVVFYETSLFERPRFADEDVNLILMGPMPEYIQEQALEKLHPLKDRIRQLISQDTVFLMTGNAIELFATEIQDDSGKTIPCLDIIKGIAKRSLLKKPRYNGFYLGEFSAPGLPGGQMEIIGFRSQFSYLYMDPISPAFKNKRGIGINPDAPWEGIHVHNFFGTYLLGPLLVLNPPFTRYILSLLGASNAQLPFEKVMEEAYQQRLVEFNDPKRKTDF